MARPRKEIDGTQLERLAAIGCTVEEMASVLSCSKDTLERRFAALIEKGRSEMKMSLRRSQIQLSKKNPAMAIWLGKQYLAQREPKIEIDVNKLDADIDRELARLAAGSQGAVAGETEGSIH